MSVTLEELRALRKTLAEHRVAHESLVTQMTVLGESCRELRRRIQSTGMALDGRGMDADRQIA